MTVGAKRGGASLARLVAAALFSVSLAWGAAAQQTPRDPVELEKEYDAAFQALFKDPGNLDKSFRFAELAVEKGNFEAAISALERMLLINPDLPRVRLELGVLYFRIGSYAIARTYLTRVSQNPDAPPEVIERVQVFLDEIDSRLTRGSLSGSVFFGARYSDNANAGPNSPNVLANGVASQLDDQFTNKADRNYFVSAQLSHSYDLLTQRNEIVESSGTLYVSEQDKQKQLDIVFLEAQTGIRGPFLQDLVPGGTMKPYILGNMVYLQDSWYQFTVGFGANIVMPLSQRLRTTINLESKSEHFRNDSERLNASQQSGVEASLSADATYVLSETQQVGVRTSAASQEAKENFNAFREFQIGGSFTQLFAIPALEEGPASVSASVTRSSSHYNQPNTTVVSGRKRRDQEWRWSLTGAVPITPDWTIVSTFQRSTVSSNIPNFENRSSAITLGASRRF
ncbi:MAG: tetratricopeptide repeat protein [Alphaproteobacteria bacterium]